MTHIIHKDFFWRFCFGDVREKTPTKLHVLVLSYQCLTETKLLRNFEVWFVEKFYENIFYFSRRNAETGNMFVFDKRTFGAGWKDTRSGYWIFFIIFSIFLKKFFILILQKSYQIFHG